MLGQICECTIEPKLLTVLILFVATESSSMMSWQLSTPMLRVMFSVRYHCQQLTGNIHSCTDQVIGPYGLLSTKARIVVTNSIAFLKQFDKIVYLRRGIILETGSYSELVNNNESELYRLM